MLLFGNSKDIYNPWSIINLLDKKQLGTYWANTSANGLIAKLNQEGDRNIKQLFETLLKGESIVCEIDEQIIYNQLSINDNAIWSLLLASGYLTVVNYIGYGDAKLPENCMPQYELKITNYETKLMFNELVKNQNLLVKGIDESNIKCYGMAFEGKNVLIACAE